MEAGIGAMGMETEAFWAMTPLEFYAAIRGWQRANGRPMFDEAMRGEELQALKARFPDA